MKSASGLTVLGRLSCALLATGITQALAQEDDQDLLTFVQLMETDIAVKTEMLDQDESPGKVTVLRGDDLEARGIRTVGESLSLVPGFDNTIDNLGVSNPVVRGVGGILASASGKVKYLINGISVNQAVSASGEHILGLPIMQVDRIEFIRGPGSAIYGEFAYTAVINVITEQDETRLGLGFGSFDTWTGMGSYSGTSESGWHFSGSVAGWRSDGDDEVVGPDILGTSGTPNEYGEHKNALLALSKKDFKVSFQYLDEGNGDYFGLSYALPPEDNRPVRSSEWYSADVEQAWHPTDAWTLRGRAGYKHYNLAFDEAYVNPPGYSISIPAFPPAVPEPINIVYPDGMIATTNYHEDRWEVSGEAIWTGLDKHTILLGAEYDNIENSDIYAINNFSPVGLPVPLPGFVRFPGEVSTLPEGYKREITSIYLQDQVRLSDQLDMTLGLRYDDYSDVGNATTPRLALVWQPLEKHILKFQYAEAFRPPTFVELSSVVTTRLGNPDIQPETSDNYELAYIFKSGQTVFRTTAFYIDMDDLITIPMFRYENSAGAKVTGLEFELDHQISKSFKLDGNISFTNTEDKETGTDMLGASDTLANVFLTYQPGVGSSYIARYRYVGARHRSATDTRNSLDANHTLDLTGSWYNVGTPGLTLRATLRNLFDEDVTDPAPENTYANDYPREGRTYWLQVTKDF